MTAFNLEFIFTLLHEGHMNNIYVKVRRQLWDVTLPFYKAGIWVHCDISKYLSNSYFPNKSTVLEMSGIVVDIAYFRLSTS